MDWPCPRNGEIAVHLDGRSDPKTDTVKPFYCADEARSLFWTSKERAGDDYSQEFVASTDWFKRFKKGFQFHNVRVTGEAKKQRKC